MSGSSPGRDDGDDAAQAVFGQILYMALVSASRGYFIATQGFQDNSLYRFDPGTGAVVSNVNGPQVVGGLFGKNLSAIAVDGNDKLWVSVADFTAPGMTVIDTVNDSIEVALIDTDLNPGKRCSARPIEQEAPHGAQAHQDLYTHG